MKFSDAICIDANNDSDNDFYVDIVHSNHKDDDWVEDGIFNGATVVKFKLDSGAQVNIIPSKVLKNCTYTLHKSSTVLKSNTGHAIKQMGRADI